MSDQDLPSLVNGAKGGDVVAITALILAIARDLRAFIATFAASPAMMEDVHTATWMQVRRQISDCPSSLEAIIWIRQRAMVMLQHRLEQECQQAIAIKDGLRHLVAQDGIEGLQALTSPNNNAAAHINQKYSELKDDAQVLIHRRYAEQAELDLLATELQLSGQAEVAIRLFIARSLLHWHATENDARAPDDRLFPVSIELTIACSIQADARKQLSLSLLKDLARAAAYIRQVRIDLLLRAVFGAFTEDDARVLAESMGKTEPKRHNESSLLHVAPPTHAPVGSGSELMRAQGLIAERQTRTPRPQSSVLFINQGKLATKRHVSSSGQHSRDNQHHNKLSKSPITLIGVGIALVGILALCVLWFGGSNNSTDHGTSAAQGKMIATVLAFQGDIVLLDGTTTKPGVLGQSLLAGQGLRSGNGEVTVELNGKTRLVLAAKSEVRSFDQLADGKGQAFINKGSLKIQSMAAPGVEIHTVQARITFGVAHGSVIAEDDRTVVQAITGVITMNAIDGSGDTITVPPGESAIALIGAAPKLIQPRTYVRGINLGGNAVTIDGNKWLAHRQALSAGLTLADGADIAAVGALSGAGLDFDRKSMIETGLSATGKPVELSQSAPNGEYDVTLWLGNTSPNTGESLSLSLNDHRVNLSSFYLPRSSWAQVGPITIKNTRPQITIRLEGLGTTRVSGLLLEAAKNDALVLSPSIRLISPTDASTFHANEEFSLHAEVIGQTKSVQFYAGDLLLGETSNPAFRLSVKIPKPGEYKLTAKTINPGIPASTSLPLGVSIAETFGTGTIVFARWGGMKDIPLSAASIHQKLSQPPGETYAAQTFQANIDQDRYYYARARGYVHPPITGNYVFWVTGNYAAELWLSSDQSPTQLKKIASTTEPSTSVSKWTQSPSQESMPIPLIQGHRYFVEFRLKAEGGKFFGAVGWKLPNGVMNRPISGEHLSPAEKP